MLQVQRQSINNVLTFFFIGELTESADFMALLGNTPMDIAINARGVTRVNSAGTGLWLKYAERLVAGGVRITYLEASPAFVPCLTFTVTPKFKGTIVSVMAPFHCPACKADVDLLVNTPDIFAVKKQITGQICPKCKGPLSFDEIPAEYFRFLA